MKQNTFAIAMGLLVVLLLGGVVWLKSAEHSGTNSVAASTASSTPTASTSTAAGSDIISTNGIHWHPHLSIIVGTTSVEIPEGIGLTGAEKPIHTHDTSGTIHLEFGGVVKQRDIELGQFFKEWGRSMDSFGTNMRMTVNGATSTAYGNYVMQDGDNIVLTYDKG